MSRMILTGGGTAGHVMPHLAIIDALKSDGWELHYVGTDGIEKTIIEKDGRIPFHVIRSGKLRRYFSFKNFLDIFNLSAGIVQSLFLLLKLRPKVVFSKGGFVSVPIAFAAKCLNIPVVSHESDFTPGLASKILNKLGAKMLCAFEETVGFLGRAALFVGSPVRKDLYGGNSDSAFRMCGFHDQNKSTLLVMGGSLGAQKINEQLEAILPQLVTSYNVIHITGAGKSINFVDPSYCSFEFVSDELKDIYALADVVVSRAGANSIFEFLYLKIPMILVPLVVGSRGDQVLNAKSFERMGVAKVMDEKMISKNLPQALTDILEDLSSFKNSVESLKLANATDMIPKILNEYR